MKPPLLSPARAQWPESLVGRRKQSKSLVYRGGTEGTFFIPPLHQEAKPKSLPRDFCEMAPTGKPRSGSQLDTHY